MSQAQRRLAPAPSDLDARAGQVRAGNYRTAGRETGYGAPRRRERAAFVDLVPCRPALGLRLADDALVRIPEAGPSGGKSWPHGRRRGAGQWAVSPVILGRTRGVRVSTPSSVSVPGTLTVRLSASRTARAEEVTGYLVLSRAGETRQIPFWSRVTASLLARRSARPLTRTGTYRGNTRSRRALVSIYRYPENPTGTGVPSAQRPRADLPRAPAPTGRKLRRGDPRAGTRRARSAADRARPRREPPGRPDGPAAEHEPVPPHLRTASAVSSVIRPAMAPITSSSTARPEREPGRSRSATGSAARPRRGFACSRGRSAAGNSDLRRLDSGAGVDPESIFASVAGTRTVADVCAEGHRMTITVPVGGSRPAAIACGSRSPTTRRRRTWRTRCGSCRTRP